MTVAKTVAKKSPAAGPKPALQVVENALKCQTSVGEISLDLRLPYANFKLLKSLDQLPEDERLDFIIERVAPEPVSKALTSVLDTAETIDLAMQWIEHVGKRLGASLGESEGSSD